MMVVVLMMSAIFMIFMIFMVMMPVQKTAHETSVFFLLVVMIMMVVVVVIMMFIFVSKETTAMTGFGSRSDSPVNKLCSGWFVNICCNGFLGGGGDRVTWDSGIGGTLMELA